MHRRSLMQGRADGTSAPNNSTTRSQIVTILYRLASGKNPNVAQGKITFSDVSHNQYYAEAISWAELKGIVKGCYIKKWFYNRHLLNIYILIF